MQKYFFLFLFLLSNVHHRDIHSLPVLQTPSGQYILPSPEGGVVYQSVNGTITRPSQERTIAAQSRVQPPVQTNLPARPSPILGSSRQNKSTQASKIRYENLEKEYKDLQNHINAAAQGKETALLIEFLEKENAALEQEQKLLLQKLASLRN